MAITEQDAGYQQNPASDTTFELLYDEDVSGRECVGLFIWTETANCEVYTDTLGSSGAPITIVAGAEKVPIIDSTAGIRKVYVRGGATAQVSWHVFAR